MSLLIRIGIIKREDFKVSPDLIRCKKFSTLTQMYPTCSIDKGYKAIAYDKLAAVLLEAIKEQQAQISNLSKENQELKDRLTKFEKMQSQIDYLQSLVGSLVKEK